MDSENQFGYTEEHILVKITRNGSTGYASINGEMKPEFDQILESEGSYFVYLLHPFRGSSIFTIDYNSENAADWIEKDIIDEIIEHLPD